MSNTNDTEATARRLVACPHVRWLPGMRYSMSIDPDWIVRVSDDSRQLAAINRLRTPADVVMIPDLDDPATLGCIEHGLLPEAWGPGCRISARWHGGLGSVRVYVEGKAVFSIESVPKAEALVAALAAAPRREVGR